MKRLTPKSMFLVLQHLLEKMQAHEIKMSDKSEMKVQTAITLLFKKIMPSNYDQLFHIYRSKIEQMLQDGYETHIITEEDREQR